MKKKYVFEFKDFETSYLRQINNFKDFSEKIKFLDFMIKRLDFCYRYNLISINSYKKTKVYLYDRLMLLKEATNYEI